MAIKVYRLVGNVIKSRRWFYVNGVQRQVLFDGGITAPFFVPGKFSTGDKELQKEIEASPAFGVDYIIESVSKEEEPVVALNDVFADEPEYTIVNSVNSIDEAKDYLMETFGVKRHKLPNKQAVLNFAERNYIKFPNMIII